MKLLVCTMKRSAPLSSCGSRGSIEIFDALKSQLSAEGLGVDIEKINCLGYCEDGPNVSARSTGKMWSKVSVSALEPIIEYCKESSKPK